MKPQRPKVDPIRNPTLFQKEELDETDESPNSLTVERPYSEPGLCLGTSAFTAKGWEGSFYPKGMRSADYLAFYAQHFHTVEVDSTFYGCPSVRTVNNWAAQTPNGFIFSVKVPRVITHEKALVDCDAEFGEFIKTMAILGPKLGPMLFQFPFFDRWKFPKQDNFLAMLAPFLKKLPADRKFVIGIRNKSWLDAKFVDVLRQHKVALALTDTSFKIASYRDVAACQFLQSADTLFAVVHRAELVQIQQLGQLTCIDAVALIPSFQQGILARIAGQHAGDVRLK